MRPTPDTAARPGTAPPQHRSTFHPSTSHGRARQRGVVRALAVLLVGAALAGAAPALAHDGEHHDGARERPTRGSSAQHSRAGVGAQVAAMRRDLARYRDVEVALADGYVPVSPCETSPEGGMGIHYLDPALVGSTDPSAPAILLYEPTADGGVRLLGAEWFSVDADQDLGTDDDRPSLLGRPFDGPMPGHGPGMPVHYDLHVWLYEANPSGLFAPWNPRVDCRS